MDPQNLTNLLIVGAGITLLGIMLFVLIILYRSNRTHARALKQKNKEFTDLEEQHQVKILKQQQDHDRKFRQLAEVCIRQVVDIGKLLEQTPGAELLHTRYQWLSDFLLAETTKLVNSTEEQQFIQDQAAVEFSQAILNLVEVHSGHHIQIIPKLSLPDAFTIPEVLQNELLRFINILIHHVHAYSHDPGVELEILADDGVLAIRLSTGLKLNLTDLVQTIHPKALSFYSMNSHQIFIPLEAVSVLHTVS